MKFRSLNLRQTGASLMEVMIAMSISLVVTAAMIALMSNSLGTTARIIQMTKLSDDHARRAADDEPRCSPCQLQRQFDVLLRQYGLRR